MYKKKFQLKKNSGANHSRNIIAKHIEVQNVLSNKHIQVHVHDHLLFLTFLKNSDKFQLYASKRLFTFYAIINNKNINLQLIC